MYAELPVFFWTVLILEYSVIENIRPLSKVDQLWSKVHHDTINSHWDAVSNVRSTQCASQLSTAGSKHPIVLPL